MKKDDIQEQIEMIRQGILAGGDRFSLSAPMVATLIDESDALAELHAFGEAYGVMKLLKFFETEPDWAGLFFHLLGVAPSEEGIYRVSFNSYKGCFWRRNGSWSWYPETMDGQVIEAPIPLAQFLYERSRQG